jgi:hypothetical protein
LNCHPQTLDKQYCTLWPCGTQHKAPGAGGLIHAPTLWRCRHSCFMRQFYGSKQMSVSSGAATLMRMISLILLLLPSFSGKQLAFIPGSTPTCSSPRMRQKASELPRCLHPVRMNACTCTDTDGLGPGLRSASVRMSACPVTARTSCLWSLKRYLVARLPSKKVLFPGLRNADDRGRLVRLADLSMGEQVSMDVQAATAAAQAGPGGHEMQPGGGTSGGGQQCRGSEVSARHCGCPPLWGLGSAPPSPTPGPAQVQTETAILSIIEAVWEGSTPRQEESDKKSRWRSPPYMPPWRWPGCQEMNPHCRRLPLPAALFEEAAAALKPDPGATASQRFRMLIALSSELHQMRARISIAANQSQECHPGAACADLLVSCSIMLPLPSFAGAPCEEGQLTEYVISLLYNVGWSEIEWDVLTG